MAIVVVGGSGKDIGKTGLVCAVITALRDFEWTAVKITAHDYSKSATPDLTIASTALIIREETQAGQETDTARYLAAGAKRALLVTRSGSMPFEQIRTALVHDRNVIFESNQIVEYLKPDLCLALASGNEKKQSYEILLRHADAVVMLHNAERQGEAEGLRIFRIASMDRLPDEMVCWMRGKLTHP